MSGQDGTVVPAGAMKAGSPIERITLRPRVRRLTVERVEGLGAAMRRVTLGGPDLADFECFGPTDHAKVFFPAESTGVLSLPTIDGGRWEDRDDPRYVSRDYTIRTFEPGSGAVVLDMAVHAHGPAGRWAAQAQPGQELGLYGPKTSKIPPMHRDWYVLAADETGLPALANWLDRLPAGPQVHALVEVQGPQVEVPLPVRDGVTVTWLHRGGADPGSTTLLADAVATLPFPPSDGSPGWLWAAGEASVVRAIRAQALARGLDRWSFSMTGYWRRGVANFDHKSPEAQG